MLNNIAVQNQINALGGNFEFNLQNIRLSGKPYGCYGFIRNQDNGVIVYVNTETSPVVKKKLTYRYATDMYDLRGCSNNTATEETFCNAVHKHLFDSNRYNRECYFAM